MNPRGELGKPSSDGCCEYTEEGEYWGGFCSVDVDVGDGDGDGEGGSGIDSGRWEGEVRGNGGGGVVEVAGS